MAVILGFYKRAFRLKVGDYRFSRLIPIHTGIFRIIGGYLCVLGKDVYYRQIMAKTHFKVVRIVRRGYFDNAGAEIYFNVIVGNDRYLAVNYRQYQRFAHYILISFIVGVYRNGGIAEQSFGAGGGEFNVAASVAERVAQMPEMPRLVLILYFGV